MATLSTYICRENMPPTARNLVERATQHNKGATMGTFSIWHWLIVLIWFGAPILSIALANKEKTLTRKPYLLPCAPVDPVPPVPLWTQWTQRGTGLAVPGFLAWRGRKAA